MYQPEIPHHDYLGLPILTAEEAVLLGHMVDYDVADRAPKRIGIHSLGLIAICDDPYIDNIVLHDREYYLEHEASGLEPKYAKKFANSIQQGYEFFIGCISWVRFFRSDETSVREFLDITRLEGEIPFINQSEVARIKAVRTGAAIVDAYGGKNPDNPSISSKSLAGDHIGDYAFESRNFGKVLDYYYESLTNNSTAIGDAHAAGVFHGIAYGAELYVQSYEERLLQGYHTDK